jgi:hypothetical protein
VTILRRVDPVPHFTDSLDCCPEFHQSFRIHVKVNRELQPEVGRHCREGVKADEPEMRTACLPLYLRRRHVLLFALGQLKAKCRTPQRQAGHRGARGWSGRDLMLPRVAAAAMQRREPTSVACGRVLADVAQRPVNAPALRVGAVVPSAAGTDSGLARRTRRWSRRGRPLAVQGVGHPRGHRRARTASGVGSVSLSELGNPSVDNSRASASLRRGELAYGRVHARLSHTAGHHRAVPVGRRSQTVG